jgi:serine/threonine protein kinase
MSALKQDRSLLLVAHTLQQKFADETKIGHCLREWLSDPHKPLRDVLLEKGALTSDQYNLLDALVSEQLKKQESAPAFAPTEPLPKSRYETVRSHKSGGMGEVLLARDLEVDRDVAMKQIVEKWADHQENQVRLLFEAEVTGGLEHPGVVPVYGIGRHPGGRPFYVMKFISGITLFDAIRSYHSAKPEDVDPAERAFEFRRLLKRFVEVCNTVAYAHSRGVIHRDLKPENVMLGSYGETLVVDWGLAELVDGKGSSASPLKPRSSESLKRFPQRGAGTLRYMAPEQFDETKFELTTQTDVYLLGAILFEIVTGRAPHVGRRTVLDHPRPSEVEGNVPVVLDQIVFQALAVNPSERFADAATLGNAVERWLDEEPVAAYREFIVQLGKAVKESPQLPELREQLARNQVSLALVLQGMRRFSEAELALREAIRQFQQLYELPDKSSRHLAEKATTRMLLSRLLTLCNRTGEADDEQRLAQADFAALIVTHPGEYQTSLASVMITMMPLAKMPGPETEEVRPVTEPSPMETIHLQEGESNFPVKTEPESELEPQARIQLRRQIGAGGAGTVWLAFDNDLQREIALKEVLPEHNSPSMQERFIAEIRAQAALEHPNILPVYGLGYRHQQNRPFAMLRLVNGRTLGEAIHVYHQQLSASASYSQRRQNLRAIIQMVVDVCKALEYAHSMGTLHLDPKPANVLLGKNGEVYLTDWGLAMHFAVEGKPARRNPEGVERFEGQVIGTPAYMSPELITGDPKQINVTTDVYGLGATLFHVLAGRPPWVATGSLPDIFRRILNEDAPVARQENAAAPKRLSDICTTAMSRKQSARYPSVKDLRLDLEQWLGGSLSERFLKMFSFGKGQSTGEVRFNCRQAREKRVYMPLRVFAFVASARRSLPVLRDIARVEEATAM